MAKIRSDSLSSDLFAHDLEKNAFQLAQAVRLVEKAGDDIAHWQGASGNSARGQLKDGAVSLTKLAYLFNVHGQSVREARKSLEQADQKAAAAIRS